MSRYSTRMFIWPPSVKAVSCHIEMRLKIGRGYVSADKNFDEDLSHWLHPD